MSSDGLRVLEAELGDEPAEAWLERARTRGAELLWLHADADLSALGFERFPGYVRLRAERPRADEPLPQLAREDFAATQDRAFRGPAPSSVPERSTSIPGVTIPP